jgi:hypothetical protein
MSGKNFFLYSLFLSFVINFFLYFIFENKSAIGQGAYCQPLPYLTFSGSWPGQGYLVMTSSTPNVLVRYAGGTLITGSGSANYISKWTSASTLGNSIIYDNGTNVGIGTTAPRSKLSVHGTRSSTISTTTAAANIGGDDVFLYINAMNSSPWGVWMQVLNNAGSAFPLVLNPSGGNVGIGTTNPQAPLTVVAEDGTYAVFPTQVSWRRKSTAQSVPSGVNTVVTFDVDAGTTLRIPNSIIWNSAYNAFQVNIPGRYYVYFSYRWENLVNAHQWCAIRRLNSDGTHSAWVASSMDANINALGMFCNGIVYLSAGQMVQAYVRQDSGANQNLMASYADNVSTNWFQIVGPF